MRPIGHISWFRRFFSRPERGLQIIKKYLNVAIGLELNTIAQVGNIIANEFFVTFPSSAPCNMLSNFLIFVLWNTSPSVDSPRQKSLYHPCMAWCRQILWWNNQHTCQYKIFEIPQPSYIIGFVFLCSRPRVSFLFLDERKIDNHGLSKGFHWHFGIVQSDMQVHSNGLRGNGRRSWFCRRLRSGWNNLIIS